MVDVKDILNKYGRKIEGEIETSSVNAGDSYSSEYQTFKEEMAPELTRYEKWCSSLGNIIKFKPSEKDRARVQRDIEIAHLNVSPEQALTLSLVSLFLVFFFAIVGSLAYVMLMDFNFEYFPTLFFVLALVFGMALFYFINGYTRRLASKWRLKASSQMVPAILYVVVYMRHTPNLEKAIAFASEHLQPPLALDFKKVFYDLEVGKYSTIKESLDAYLDTWRDFSPEFIEAFHLIESSLFESDNARRITILEKGLQVVLDGVYEKMLKFVHNVKSPLTNVYMLGVVLPTLALALLPLASAMLKGAIGAIHVFILFNLLVPFFVFYLVDKILFLRPGGHGETGLLERNPHYYKYKSNKAYFKAFVLVFPLILISLLPLIFQFTPLPELLNLQKDYTFAELGFGFFEEEQLFGFKTLEDGSVVGPFGLIALILSLFFPFSIALFFSIVYSGKTKDLIKEREATNRLEEEFNSSLFQLGNRLGNGTPPELVFGKVAESAKGLKTEDFFRRVNYNVQQMGMSVESAVFDRSRGALIYYPSELISTSMKILVESSKKGLKIAAISLMSISEYVKNLKKISSRLKDMLAEVVSDMKSNMTFLAPLLSGIVIGLASMIVTILSKLNISQISGAAGGGVGGLSGFGGLLDIFNANTAIPPYYLQIIVGIYLIEIIFILTGALVTVDSGEDKLEETNKKGKNLVRGVGIYFVIALIAASSLYFLASIVLTGLG
jgi:Flp pilus assembly protein TadB